MLNESQRRLREQVIYRAVLDELGRGAALGELTVSQIAAAAGMGKGTVYEYFSSKQEVVAGLTRYCLQNELALITAALTPCAALRPAIDAICAYLRDLADNRGATYRILAQVVQQNHDVLPPESKDELMEGLQTSLLALLARLRQNGELGKDLTDSYCVNAVAAACLTAAVRLMPCTAPPTEPQREALLRDTAALLQRALEK